MSSPQVDVSLGPATTTILHTLPLTEVRHSAWHYLNIYTPCSNRYLHLRGGCYYLLCMSVIIRAGADSNNSPISQLEHNII